MASVSDWKVPASVQPKPEDYAYDLEAALSAVVGVRAIVPPRCLHRRYARHRARRQRRADPRRRPGADHRLSCHRGRDDLADADRRPRRAGHGAGLRPGHRLRPGPGAGAARPAGAADRSSSAVSVGERVVVGGAGGRQKSVAARIVAKQEFAGYWEYVVDEAIFTAPSHPNWGGTALIGPSGDLIGIGSLQLQEGREQGPPGDINMIVPIDLLKPIFDDLLTLGRPNKPPRPWLGLYATAIENRIVVVGLAKDGPAQKADLRTGDVLLSVGGRRGARSRGALSQGLVARRGRGRDPDVDLSRRQDHRDAPEVRRPQPVPEGAEAALTRTVASAHMTIPRRRVRARRSFASNSIDPSPAKISSPRIAGLRPAARRPPAMVLRHVADLAGNTSVTYAILMPGPRPQAKSIPALRLDQACRCARARHHRQRRHVVVRGGAAGRAGRFRRGARRGVAAVHADHGRLRRRRHPDGPARRSLRHHACRSMLGAVAARRRLCAVGHGRQPLAVRAGAGR